MNSLGETNPMMVERTYRSIEKMIQTNKTFMIVKLALLNYEWVYILKSSFCLSGPESSVIINPKPLENINTMNSMRYYERWR